MATFPNTLLPVAAAHTAGHEADHEHHHAHPHDHAGHAHRHDAQHGHAAAKPRGERALATPRVSLIALSGLQRLLLVAPVITLLWLLTLWAISNGAMPSG